jgi:hypothetical protein
VIGPFKLYKRKQTEKKQAGDTCTSTTPELQPNLQPQHRQQWHPRPPPPSGLSGGQPIDHMPLASKAAGQREDTHGSMPCCGAANVAKGKAALTHLCRSRRFASTHSRVTHHACQLHHHTPRAAASVSTRERHKHRHMPPYPSTMPQATRASSPPPRTTIVISAPKRLPKVNAS